MTLCFHERAWNDYLHWQRSDPKTLRRLNALLKDVVRDPFDGLGKPEPLTHEWSGWYSRRIDAEHRLVYQVEGDVVFIAQCRFHYE